MTIEQAIEEVKRSGSLDVVGEAIHYQVRKRHPGTVEALATLRARKSEVLAILSGAADHQKTEPLELVLKGQAIELWSTMAGRLFLVADQEDALLAMERYGVRLGEIYTAMEARCIVTVGDPEAVAEIHDWKRQFDGVVRETGKPQAP
jgi:hypothetical protein